MLTLSVQQPWAWLIVNGFKPVENRSWSTAVRAPILIHAGKKVDKSFDFAWAEKLIGRSIPRFFPPGEDRALDNGYQAMTGGIVGRARLVDCVKAHPSPFFFGEYGFVLADAELLPFTPIAGKLGFFEVPTWNTP